MESPRFNFGLNPGSDPLSVAPIIRLIKHAGLVVGIANNQSTAWGCAKAFHIRGADLAITYLNEKIEPHVRPLAQQLGRRIILPLAVARTIGGGL